MPSVGGESLCTRVSTPVHSRAIAWFTRVLGFELIEDSTSFTDDGRRTRWVVVRPADGGAGLLLAKADGEVQAAVVGQQVPGRVGFFLQVDDFEASYQRMVGCGVEFTSPRRSEPYGEVAVFRDVAGNLWDLLGPT